MHSISNGHPLPTDAEVDAALAGIGVPHSVWALVNQSWDESAWGTALYESTEGRKGRCLEAARVALDECRRIIAEGSESTLERLSFAALKERMAAGAKASSDASPKGDGWADFSRQLFATDDPMAACPKAHEAGIASRLHRAGFNLDDVRRVLDHAARMGSVEDLDVLPDSLRPEIERLLPTAPDSVWRVFERFTWATNDRRGVPVGQPA